MLLFYPFLLAAMWVKSKSMNIVLLAFVLLQYPLLSLIDLIDPSQLA